MQHLIETYKAAKTILEQEPKGFGNRQDRNDNSAMYGMKREFETPFKVDVFYRNQKEEIPVTFQWFEDGENSKDVFEDLYAGYKKDLDKDKPIRMK